MNNQGNVYLQEAEAIQEENRLQQQQLASLQAYADFSTNKLKALLSTIDVKFDDSPYAPFLLRHVASVFIKPLSDQNIFYVRTVNDRIGLVAINSLLSLKNRFPNLFFKITQTDLVNIMAVTNVVDNGDSVTVKLIAGEPLITHMDMCYNMVCELAQWEDVLNLWAG